MTLSKERLEEILGDETYVMVMSSEIMDMTRELLERRERDKQDPLLILRPFGGLDQHAYVECPASHPFAMSVYAAPLAPVVQPVQVPDAICVRQAIANMERHEYCDTINVAYKRGWNDCRAAMLKAGPVTASTVQEIENLEHFIAFWRKVQSGAISPSKSEIDHTLWFLERLATAPAAPEQEV